MFWNRRSRISRLALSCVALTLALPAALARAADGDLDPTFDFDGIATLTTGNARYFSELAVQPDGKLVGVGKREGAGSDDLFLARFNPDGSLEASFGLGGVATLDTGGNEHAQAIVVLSDGKILVAGSRSEFVLSVGQVHKWLLARFSSDGTLDTSFGSGGYTLTSLTTLSSGSDSAYGLAVQPDGKIVLAGGVQTAQGTNGSVLGVGVGLARYTANGVLDTTFGTGGKVVISAQLPAPWCGSEGRSLLEAVALLPDGRIVGSGEINRCGGPNGWLVARFLPNGAPDGSFGTGGFVNTANCEPGLLITGSVPWSGAYAIHPLADSSLLLGGTCSGNAALARVTPTGQLDASFGVNGLAIASVWEFAFDMTVQTDGRPVLVGARRNPYNQWEVGVSRFREDGSPDDSFGASGHVVTHIGAESWANTVRQQADGKLVVGGYGFWQAFVARYLSAPIFCGDGAVNGDDECDDGNGIGGDGCRPDCTEELCGDAVVDPQEQCDDGNPTSGDGCQANCALPVCGDGIGDPGEECDDGNGIGGDGCSETCHVEVCGNGTVDPGEHCDDANAALGDGCRSDCTQELCGDAILDPQELCDDANNAPGDGCRADCTAEVCGDGVLDPQEQCDDGNTGSGDGCQAICVLPQCGDGVTDAGEQCDDENAAPGDGCSATCALEVCGNGILDPGEQCDDGNTAPADGCRADCSVEVCGDGILDPQEQCDDGNATSGDGCSAACVIEQASGGQGCRPRFWRTHPGQWPAAHPPSALFASVFENAFPEMTLEQVLRQRGGGLKALGRQTVAALLNAASGDVGYDLTAAEVVAMFNDTYPGTKSAYRTLTRNLRKLNKKGCPRVPPHDDWCEDDDEADD
jgi:uncharacterized delta-60 repeat protein